MAVKLTFATRVIRAPATVWREIDGRAVVIDLDGGRVRTLNPTGSVLWQSLDGCSLGELRDRLVAEFPDESPERLTSDVESFVADLVERGLAEIEAG